MPLFAVDVEKTFAGEFWTNRYVVNTTSLANADEAADIIVTRERSFHRVDIEFTKVRTRTLAAGDDVYSSRPIGADGLLASNGPYLPLFNVVRCDFSVEGGGRPSRKYYRLGICAGDVLTNFNVANAIVSAVEAGTAGMIAELEANASPLVDVDAQVIVEPTAFSTIGMRQLRKGSKRRTTPIL